MLSDSAAGCHPHGHYMLMISLTKKWWDAWEGLELFLIPLQRIRLVSFSGFLTSETAQTQTKEDKTTLNYDGSSRTPHVLGTNCNCHWYEWAIRLVVKNQNEAGLSDSKCSPRWITRGRETVTCIDIHTCSRPAWRAWTWSFLLPCSIKCTSKCCWISRPERLQWIMVFHMGKGRRKERNMREFKTPSLTQLAEIRQSFFQADMVICSLAMVIQWTV